MARAIGLGWEEWARSSVDDQVHRMFPANYSAEDWGLRMFVAVMRMIAVVVIAVVVIAMIVSCVIVGVHVVVWN